MAPNYQIVIQNEVLNHNLLHIPPFDSRIKVFKNYPKLAANPSRIRIHGERSGRHFIFKAHHVNSHNLCDFEGIIRDDASQILGSPDIGLEQISM